MKRQCLGNGYQGCPFSVVITSAMGLRLLGALIKESYAGMV